MEFLLTTLALAAVTMIALSSYSLGRAKLGPRVIVHSNILDIPLELGPNPDMVQELAAARERERAKDAKIFALQRKVDDFERPDYAAATATIKEAD